MIGEPPEQYRLYFSNSGHRLNAMLRPAFVLSIVVCVIASAPAGVLRAQSLGEIAAAEARRKAAGAKSPADGNADSQTPEKTKTDPGGKAAEKPKAAAATASQ